MNILNTFLFLFFSLPLLLNANNLKTESESTNLKKSSNQMELTKGVVMTKSPPSSTKKI